MANNDDNSPSALTRGTDPTETVLSESALDKKYLCDYIVNSATGCSHGCEFCYVPSTPAIRTRGDMLASSANVESPQEEWGEYVLYRDEIPEKLPGILDRKRTWKSTRGGQGIVWLSSGTDCYMDPRAAEITRGAVEALVEHGKYVRILTRNPTLALSDINLYERHRDNVIVGSSIPTVKNDEISAIETNAPAVSHRLDAMETFAEADVRTFVSMSPTYPTMGTEAIATTLSAIEALSPEVVFHEPINPRGSNFQRTIDAAWKAGEEQLGSALAAVRDREVWTGYAVTQFYYVQQIAMDRDIPLQLWPPDTLLNEVSGNLHEWLHSWRKRQSPERFADRPSADPIPPLPPAELVASSTPEAIPIEPPQH